MANAGADKSEKATPKRRKQAREEGQVAKSVDLSSALILIVAFILLLFLGSAMLESIKEITVNNLSTLDISELTSDGVIAFITEHIVTVVKLLAPLLAALMLCGVVLNVAQVGPLFSVKAIKPSPSKVNPIQGFKRIFSLRGFVELFKGIFKVVIIGAIGFYSIYPHRAELMVLSSTDLVTAGHIIYNIIFSICWKVCILLLVLGIIDYIYQKYEFEKSIKMTKQEVKDEYKNIEGNPEIKRKIKSIQMHMAQNRMMKKIPEADVIVTNPTHYAVALKYDPSIAPAPIVLAKGVDLLAKRIKETAREHKIPIVENKPLARSLYKLVDLNKMVPEDLFIAVAEVLAYVYKKNKGKKRRKLVK